MLLQWWDFVIELATYVYIFTNFEAQFYSIFNGVIGAGCSSREAIAVALANHDSHKNGLESSFNTRSKSSFFLFMALMQSCIELDGTSNVKM